MQLLSFVSLSNSVFVWLPTEKHTNSYFMILLHCLLPEQMTFATKRCTQNKKNLIKTQKKQKNKGTEYNLCKISQFKHV